MLTYLRKKENRSRTGNKTRSLLSTIYIFIYMNVNRPDVNEITWRKNANPFTLLIDLDVVDGEYSDATRDGSLPPALVA